MKETQYTHFHTTGKKTFEIVVALLCSVVIIFISLSIFSVFRNRQSYLNEARIKSRSQAQLLAENSTSIIYGADLTLLPLRSMIQHQRSPGDLSDTNAIQTFEPELRLLPQIRDVLLLNSKGTILYSSQGTQKFDLAAFSKHRDAWLDFSVDAVIALRGKAKIVLSRRIENQKNQFLGVLAAVVDPNFFYDRFSDDLDVGMQAFALVDMKGRMLTGWSRGSNGKETVIGTNILDLPHFSSFSEALLNRGGRSTHENSTGIVSIHQLQGFPFHVAVSYGKNDVLKKWRRESGRDIATVFFTTLIAALTLTMAYRHQLRRKKAEQALLAHHEKLEKTVAERTAQLTETNRELIQKNEALQNALAEVKTLGGLLPICARCKKIRDDKGYWSQLESYIQKHSDASFSHGMCPECSDTLYGDQQWYIKMKKKKGYES